MRPQLIAFDLDGTLVEDHLLDVPCSMCGGTGEGDMPIALAPDSDLIPDECERCDGRKTVLAPRTDLAYTEPVLIPEVKARLGELTPYGNHFAIVTNQGGVALGFQTEDEVLRRIARSLELINFFDMQTFSIHFCLHHPEGRVPGYENPTALDLFRRKPNSGMLVEAMEPGGWTSGRTIYVGDRSTDRKAAEGVCRFVNAEDWWAEGIETPPANG